ncbi:hypothetical protein D9758_012172 [Tetrapyrgos nigripes]|uniref:SAC3/GANP/THP3 conserved domain-containing protein n=1 Tax=Tetrapyrgos nigripes TaxID=182062 RepID=A0A8H5FL84_9AGAR|nr:hypothetical protein D9758_012172 [Tetrapyrgos nigripes]
MEASSASRHRGRGASVVQDGRRPHSRNKTWKAGDPTNRSETSTPHHGSDGERWERGGHRGGGRGSRGGGRGSARGSPASGSRNLPALDVSPQDEPILATQEERDEFYRELSKAREIERKNAIAEGKMDDPLVPKRLEDAITMVGTCTDMCPRFERYRRERENNLFEWEVIPGTKRVDHQRAVKMYERAAGDKVIPSDLRPPHVLKRTLDYLFHDLLPRGGFSPTFNFIRDRSRAVRNDFTMQHQTGELAIKCHDRCARFHIVALHLERETPGFSIEMEEQQLMNTLQSLKEFYEDQRGRYESPTELEMRVYHRLIHIRDQRERHDDIPQHILSNPVFQLTTEFRRHVQQKSAPITKRSALMVDAKAMEIFSRLANVLREQGNVVMIYLVACILERLFGKETIDNIEDIRNDLSIPDIIDGVVTESEEEEQMYEEQEMHDELIDEAEGPQIEEIEPSQPQTAFTASPWPAASTVNGATSAFGFPSSSSTPQSGSAFSNLQTSSTNAFGTASVFGTSAFQSAPNPSVFGAPATANGLSAFAQAAHATAASIPKQVDSSAPVSVFSSSSTPSAFQPARPNLAPPNPPALSLLHAPAPQAPKPPTRSLVDAPPLIDELASPAPPAMPSPFSLPQSDTTKSIFSTPLPFGIQSKPPTATTNVADSALNPTAPIFKPSSSLPPASTPPPQRAQPQKPPPLLFNTPSPVPPISTIHPAPLFSQPSGLSPTVNGSNVSPTTGLPRINTTNLQPRPQPAETAAQVPSTPTVPPLLPRPQPISLPPTPTVPSAATSNPHLAFLKPSLITANLPSSSSTEILSPLQLNSPAVSRQSSIQNFAGLSTPTVKRSFTFDGLGLAQGHSSPLGAKGKGKAKALDNDDDVTEPFEEEISKAVAFERRSSVVKICFSTWREQFAERVAYAEAVRNSDDYKTKLQQQQQQQLAKSQPKPSGIIKRRLSSISLNSSVPASGDLTMRSPAKKRARHRESRGYQPPRTDDELAKRLKENQEEHQHWWAQGSLLQVARNHVKDNTPLGSNKSLLKNWAFWISFNPVVDATAIWVQKKFSVPDSGDWLGDVAFSIPLIAGADPRTASPGVIIFECTPVDGIDDELERKYRALDDCARLRDIIKALLAKRCFIPSLLVLYWSEGSSTTPAPDFLDMVNKLVQDEVLGNFSIFPVTTATKDVDSKFSNALASTPIDVEGKLVRSLTLSGVFKFFDASLDSFASEWIENISIHGHFNWMLYGRLIQSVVALLNTMMELISRLLDADHKESLPSFPADVEDSMSGYDTAIEWLVSARLDSHNIAADLQAHRDIGHPFPAHSFIEYLRELIHLNTERFLGLSSNSLVFHVPISDLESASHEWKMSIEPHQVSMNQALTLSLRRSPKRRSLSSAVDTESSSSKRRRLSVSGSSSVDTVSFPSRSPTPSPLVNGNGRLSVSPDPSDGAVTVSSDTEVETPKAPTVTIAMLRALTKNLKEKYGSSSS